MSQSFAFMVEVNDLTSSVIWANIPDVNVPASAVTQHVALIDHDTLLNFVANEHIDWTADAGASNIDVNNITAVPEAAVTAHEAALTILQSQVTIVSETATNLADITNAINTGAAKVAGYFVWDSTNNAPVWAVGGADGDVWVDGVGTTVHTPV